MAWLASTPGWLRGVGRVLWGCVPKVKVYRVLPSRKVTLDSGLSKPVRSRIDYIVTKTRLWEAEKAEVAQRLVGEFRDGLDAGESQDELLDRYRPARRIAKPLRAEMRQRRSRAWWVRHRIWQGIWIASVVGYIGLGVYYAAGNKTVNVDYLAQLNARAASVPEGDRAWPVYRDVLLRLPLDGLEAADRWELTADEHDFDSPAWVAAIAFLQTHRDELAVLRAASQKPGLGFVLSRQYTGADLALFARDGVAETGPAWFEPRGELLTDVSLPHLRYLRLIGRLLNTDAIAAAQRGDAERCVADLLAAMRLGDHAGDHSLLFCQLIRVSFYAMVNETLSRLLHDYPGLFTQAQLTALMEPVASGIGIAYDHPGERLLFDDYLQHAYTDNGRGNGHLNAHVIHERFRPYVYRSEEGDPHWVAVGLWYAFSPITISAMASRREMHDLYHDAVDRAQAAYAHPMRELPTQALPESLVAVYDSPWRHLRYPDLIQGWPISDAPRKGREVFRGRAEGTLLGLALERYRLDTGGYPDALDALVPSYIETLPVDRISGAALRYRLTEAGPVVYSVGSDGDDDGGRMPAHYHREAVSYDADGLPEGYHQVWRGDNYAAARWDQQDPADGDWVVWPLYDPPVMPEPAGARKALPESWGDDAGVAEGP